MSEAIDVTTGAVEEPKRHSPFVDFFLRLAREKPLGLIGGIIVLLMLLTGILADLLAPYGYNEYILADRLAGPSPRHLLGTDALGRDLFSRVIYGARISMIVGLGASAINVAFSALVGVTSGFIGGKFDMIVQRFVDAALTFPMLIIVITLARAAVIAIRENVYVDAARAIGCSTREMLIRHILPNITPILIIMFSVSMSGNILGEASLSFLGFGIPPPFPSWGGMLSSEGRRYMYEAPWLAIWPGVALSVAVYGINMWGDAVRDLLDPRLRGGVGRYGRAVKTTRQKENKKSKGS